jgi:pimeloyl-ACP methyl ester carboxylesterase
MSMRLLSVGGGRTLAYEEAGDPAGAPLFLSHGTPGCRLSARHPDLARVRAAGLRLVTYDRPGYGHSTRQPERRVVDCVEDVAAIAEALVIERFPSPVYRVADRMPWRWRLACRSGSLAPPASSAPRRSTRTTSTGSRGWTQST